MELPNGHFIKLGTGLESEERDVMTPILVGNIDLFAWSAANLLGVDPQVASHKLSIYKEARYISQKKRKRGEERRLAAKGEADKLMSAGFIEKSHYTTWLSNVVLVKKAAGCVLTTRILIKPVPDMPTPYPILTDLLTARPTIRFSAFLMYTLATIKSPWPHPT